MYIVRFGTMRKTYKAAFALPRKTYKAAEWATVRILLYRVKLPLLINNQEAQKSRTGIFWNVWVLLAMPAAWLAW